MGKFIWGPESTEETPGGDRGLWGGGNYLATIDVVNLSTAGNTEEFGDLTSARSELAACSNGPLSRGVFGGGDALVGGTCNIIDYVMITVNSNATNFGDFTVVFKSLGATSNTTLDRGVFGAGRATAGATVNIIEYITISTAGNADDFGDLTVARRFGVGASNASLDRGCFMGGNDAGGTKVNTIDYITVSTTGNATNFGDLTDAGESMAGTSNRTADRGIRMGGSTAGGAVNTIDYITISSASDATNFGDLAAVQYKLEATSNGVRQRAVSAGGNGHTNVMEYITINSAGDASNFGDLTVGRDYLGACSNA